MIGLHVTSLHYDGGHYYSFLSEKNAMLKHLNCKRIRARQQGHQNGSWFDVLAGHRQQKQCVHVLGFLRTYIVMFLVSSQLTRCSPSRAEQGYCLRPTTSSEYLCFVVDTVTLDPTMVRPQQHDQEKSVQNSHLKLPLKNTYCPLNIPIRWQCRFGYQKLGSSQEGRLASAPSEHR